MFRPIPESTVFRSVPFRVIASVLLILALALSLILLVGIQLEPFLAPGFTDGKAVPLKRVQSLWQSRTSLIGIAALLFLISAVGLTSVVTFIYYRNTRRTLEEVKNLARTILQSIPTGVLTVNDDGVVTAVNPTAEQVLRRHSGGLLGHAYRTVFAEGDPIRAALDQALQDGQYFTQKDLPYEDTQRVGRTIRVGTAPLTGDDGNQSGVILQAQDVTDWLALEQRVRTAEKLTALHTLSAGVAHELRNPLGAMDLHLHLLEEELRESGQCSPIAGRYLRVLNAECRRLSGILDNFLRFARPGTPQPHEVDIQGVVEHVSSLLRHEAGERNIRIDLDMAPDLPPVLGDEVQISQVLVNILVNAFQAMPEGGLCRVTTYMKKDSGLEQVVITVHDTGVGIRQEDLSRLFEPFYSTKTSGSGLGLAIAYRIVQDHGGTISVSSTPASGTLVTIAFPARHVPHEAAVNP
jgi:PAS domain S-box-containing protein